jgi:hypothetical protein
LGSHKCTVNIGNFTKNPPIVSIHAKDNDEYLLGNSMSINIGIIGVFDTKKILVRDISIGREAATV